MRKKRLMCALAVMVMLAGGCSTMKLIHSDPNAELVAANRSLRVAQDAVTDMIVTGLLSGGDIDTALQVAREANDYLDQWEADVAAGTPRPGALEHFNALLKQLKPYYDRGIRQ
jgi:hypothetical protein